jgi:DNA-binding HxlR family transcriptional regulator
VLLDGPHASWKSALPASSQKVLIELLRALEEHQMVIRQPSAGNSQGIDHLLTPLGESLRPVLDSLRAWGAHHAKELGP